MAHLTDMESCCVHHQRSRLMSDTIQDIITPFQKLIKRDSCLRLDSPHLLIIFRKLAFCIKTFNSANLCRKGPLKYLNIQLFIMVDIYFLKF